MKKIIALLMVLTLAVAVFVACDGGEKTPVEKDYTLSIGVVVKENLAGKKIDETVATIVTDSDGKIVLCRLDSIKYEAKYDEAGALNTKAPSSNVALGDNYGQMPAGTWAKQGAALEKYVIGKTQAEVAGVVSNGYAADAELKASCSIAISDLVKAIDNAFKSAHKVAFKSTATEFTAGLNVAGAIKDSSTDESKNATFTTTYSAAVLAQGKVVAAILDCAEAELKGMTDEEGASSISYAGTKREQGDSYAMTSGAWYVQADAYAKSAVGKSASDISGLATEGVAGCTMPYSVFDFKPGLEAAVKNAR